MQLTLSELFPGSKGLIFPPIVTFQYEQNNLEFEKNLRRIDGRTKLDASYILAKRENYVIGWKFNGNTEPLFTPEGKTDVIFDINHNRFIKLTNEELSALGVCGRLSTVRANDEVLRGDMKVAQGYHAGDLQAKRQAHFEAERDAALQAAFESRIQARRPNQNDAASIRAIHRTYRNTYKKKFHQAYHSYARDNTQNHFYK